MSPIFLGGKKYNCRGTKDFAIARIGRRGVEAYDGSIQMGMAVLQERCLEATPDTGMLPSCRFLSLLFSQGMAVPDGSCGIVAAGRNLCFYRAEP